MDNVWEFLGTILFWWVVFSLFFGIPAPWELVSEDTDNNSNVNTTTVTHKSSSDKPKDLNSDCVYEDNMLRCSG